MVNETQSAVDNTATRSLMPSASTMASVGIGVPLATILSWGFSTFLGVSVPGPVEAAFGAVLSAVIGYFFEGGKHATS